MWYRFAQALNIVSPIPGLPGAPPPVAPPPVPAPTPGPGNATPLTPPTTSPTAHLPRPPLHDNCHCKIVTNLDGSERWDNDSACEYCAPIRDAFNRVQPAAFGV